MTIRLILLKKITKVEFYDENDKISRNIEKFDDYCIVGILLIWLLTL